ncbi:hypothetical protein BJ912DRAFT_1094255 [Pholiota molesta]|nr:hypothetical protein BJ912DRAFT_1094255 [Pholiota molesta]
MGMYALESGVGREMRGGADIKEERVTQLLPIVAQLLDSAAGTVHLIANRDSAVLSVCMHATNVVWSLRILTTLAPSPTFTFRRVLIILHAMANNAHTAARGPSVPVSHPDQTGGSLARRARRPSSSVGTPSATTALLSGHGPPSGPTRTVRLQGEGDELMTSPFCAAVRWKLLAGRRLARHWELGVSSPQSIIERCGVLLQSKTVDDGKFARGTAPEIVS